MNKQDNMRFGCIYKLSYFNQGKKKKKRMAKGVARWNDLEGG